MKRVVIVVAIVFLMCSSVFAITIKIDETKDVPMTDSSIHEGVIHDKLREKVTRHVYGLGHVADITNGEITYLHQDRLGSTRLATDSEGSVVGEFKSLPFGQEIVNEDIRYSFATGKELDSSGLYYFGARYYDADLGRFISVDPVEDNHAYSYVTNNPMNYVDPTGMEEFDIKKYHFRYSPGEDAHDVTHIDVYKGKKHVLRINPVTGEPIKTGGVLVKGHETKVKNLFMGKLNSDQDFARTIDDIYEKNLVHRGSMGRQAWGGMARTERIKNLVNRGAKTAGKRLMLLSIFVVGANVASAAESGGFDAGIGQASVEAGGFGGGFAGAALVAKVASPLLVAPVLGSRILYGGLVFTGGCIGGICGEGAVESTLNIKPPTMQERADAFGCSPGQISCLAPPDVQAFQASRQ
jgi:RHS repeat-associated protein